MLSFLQLLMHTPTAYCTTVQQWLPPSHQAAPREHISKSVTQQTQQVAFSHSMLYHTQPGLGLFSQGYLDLLATKYWCLQELKGKKSIKFLQTVGFSAKGKIFWTKSRSRLCDPATPPFALGSVLWGWGGHLTNAHWIAPTEWAWVREAHPKQMPKQKVLPSLSK